MSAVATFVYADWIARYPELANTAAPQAQLCFNEAALYLNNTGWGGKVWTNPAQTQLMLMLTAHIAFLYFGDINDPPASGSVVGHINQAAQGSVSISTELASNLSMAQAWFTQTKYGFSFWQATANLRTASYRANYRSPLVGGPYQFPGRPFI